MKRDPQWPPRPDRRAIDRHGGFVNFSAVMEIAAVLGVLALAVFGLPSVMDALVGMSDDKPQQQLPRVAIYEVTGFSADGRIYYRSLNGSLWWLDLETGIHEQIALPSSAQVTAVSRSPEARLLATGLIDGRVLVQRFVDGRTIELLPEGTPPGHDSVTTLRFTTDGQRLAVGSDAGLIVVWDVSDESLDAQDGRAAQRGLAAEAQRQQFASHADSVLCLRWLPDGRLVSTGRDSRCRLWDVERGQLVREFVGHAELVFSLDVSSDGRMLVTGGKDFTARAWDIETGQLLWSTRLSLPWITDVALHPTGPVICGGPRSGPISLLDRQTGRLLRQVPGHVSGLATMQFDPEGRRMISAGYDGRIRLWHTGHDAADWHTVREFDCGCL